jgi:hypothetical protein
LAGNSSIYRIDTTGQNEAWAVTNNQIIEFNSGAAPDDRGNIISTNVLYLRDVAVHPNPKRSLNVLQDTLAGTKEVTITGYFEDPIGSGTSQSLLDTWMLNKATNSSLKFGRFGLRLDDATTHNLVPDATGGYILHYLYTERPEDSPDEVTFVAKLYLNKPTTPT